MSESLSFSKLRREKILAVSAGGVCVAVAYVLSLIKVFEMPQGGSVTLASMLPIFFFALCFGPVWGFSAAFLFGLLQLIGGYLLMPIQVLLDYTLAFTALGCAGFFAAPLEKRIGSGTILARMAIIPPYKMILGVLLGMSLRMLCHVISGVVFFAEYAGEQNPWIYSIFYNGAYLLPEAAITIFFLLFVMMATRVNKYGPETNITVTIGDWMVSFLLMCVFPVNLIMLFVWAFGTTTPRSKKNWAIARLIMILIFVVLMIIFLTIITATVGMKGFLTNINNFFYGR